MLKFEYDPNKSATNFDKHGINFVQAQQLWHDPHLIEVRAKANSESRYLVVGLIKGKHWSAIVKYRWNKIRVISVRRSRATEVAFYEA